MSEAVSSAALSLPARVRRIKKAVWISLGAGGLLFAVVLILPSLIDLGMFKSTYLPLVEETLNRRVDVNEVRLGLVPTPSIRLSNLRVSNGPASPGEAFFSAQQVRLQVKFLPLLRGRFEITELIIDKPVFNLPEAPNGRSHDASGAGKKAAPAARRDGKKKLDGPKRSDAPSVPIIIPGRMTIHDGQLRVAAKGQTPVLIKGIDLSLQEFSGDRPFPFRASFEYPGLKTISLEGALNYQEDKALLEFKSNRLMIQDLNLPLEGSVSHLFTTPRLNLSIHSDNIDAKPIFQILSVFGLAPRDTEISGPMRLALNLAGPANSPTTQVRGFFKNVQVNGKRALKGSLSGEVSIRLPLGGGAGGRLEGTGKLIARDGELTNVDLIEKIQRVTGMIGLSKKQRREATTFQRLESDFILGGGYAEFTRLYLINSQMEVIGDGTMTLEQPTFDMAIRTALSAQASARAGRGRAITFFKDDRGRIVVPMKVTGPVENPSVNLNAAALPRNADRNFSSLFQQLFRSR
jgi:AsmA protein